MPSTLIPPANDNDTAADRWVDALIGKTVRRRRQELGIGQGELAARAGLPAAHIERYESGEWRMPAAVLFKLADALDAPLADLLRAI